MSKGGKGVYRGTASGNKAECTITVSDDDFVGLATGRLNGQQVRSLRTGPSISHFQSQNTVSFELQEGFD